MATEQWSYEIGLPERYVQLDIPRELTKGLIKARTRFRNDDFGRVYLRYEDRIERWVVMMNEDRTRVRPGTLESLNA